jgi:hypothetical protein
MYAPTQEPRYKFSVPTEMTKIFWKDPTNSGIEQATGPGNLLLWR